MRSEKPNELVSAEEVADHFNVSVEAVRRWAREGRIPSFRVNQRIIRFRLTDVERTLAHPAEVRADPQARATARTGDDRDDRC